MNTITKTTRKTKILLTAEDIISMLHELEYVDIDNYDSVTAKVYVVREMIGSAHVDNTIQTVIDAKTPIVVEIEAFEERED